MGYASPRGRYTTLPHHERMPHVAIVAERPLPHTLDVCGYSRSGRSISNFIILGYVYDLDRISSPASPESGVGGVGGELPCFDPGFWGRVCRAVDVTHPGFVWFVAGYLVHRHVLNRFPEVFNTASPTNLIRDMFHAPASISCCPRPPPASSARIQAAKYIGC